MSTGFSLVMSKLMSAEFSLENTLQTSNENSWASLSNSPQALTAFKMFVFVCVFVCVCVCVCPSDNHR